MPMHKRFLLNILPWLILGLVTGCSQTIPASPSTLHGTTLPTETIISGVVMAEDGHPIPGATVRVKASEQHVLTGSDGKFELTSLEQAKSVILTAWAPGYYINGGSEKYLPGATGLQFVLKKISETDNPNYRWLSAFASAGDAGNCENCHANSQDPALPFSQWKEDAHALSANNVRFLSMYLGRDLQGNQSPPRLYGYNRDYGRVPLAPDLSKPYFGPGYKLDFPDTTGNCATCHIPAVAIIDPNNTDPTSATGVGKEGITCDVCHKVWDVQLNPNTGLPYPNMTGVVSLVFRRPAQDQQFFAGPFDDVAPGRDTYTPIQQQSQFCAACHFGTFWNTQVYNSFGEWLASPYNNPRTGRTCQDCHMPTAKNDHFARLDKGAMIRDPMVIFSHQMPGASDTNLLQNAVSLIANAHNENNQIIVKVSVTNNNTGHDVPTDSPLRQVILMVRAYDQNGKVLTLLSGPTIPEWGGVGNPKDGYDAGLPGKIYAKTLMELWTGITPSGAYWNPTRIISDTRLAPFESDTSSYSFSNPGIGSAQIEVKLLYRRAFITLRDQKGWGVPDIIMNHQEFSISSK